MLTQWRLFSHFSFTSLKRTFDHEILFDQLKHDLQRWVKLSRLYKIITEERISLFVLNFGTVACCHAYATVSKMNINNMQLRSLIFHSISNFLRTSVVCCWDKNNTPYISVLLALCILWNATVYIFLPLTCACIMESDHT